MKYWEKLLDHYRYDCDGTELENLLEEAIASLESKFGYTNKDDLITRSRHLALSYLALNDAKRKLIRNKKRKKKLKNIIADINLSNQKIRNELKEKENHIVELENSLMTIEVAKGKEVKPINGNDESLILKFVKEDIDEVIEYLTIMRDGEKHEQRG